MKVDRPKTEHIFFKLVCDRGMHENVGKSLMGIKLKIKSWKELKMREIKPKK